MPHIGKAKVNALGNRQHLAIGAGTQLRDGAERVIHVVNGFNSDTAGSFCFSVLPFCLRHLDMRRVPEHNVAQITGFLCGIDGTPEAILV